jgi:hypothetical protein
MLDLFVVSFVLRVRSLRVTTGALLDNSAGSIALDANRVFQETGSSFVFGCAFAAVTTESFVQQGQASQRINSVTECIRLLANAPLGGRFGYFIQSPNITASGMCCLVWIYACTDCVCYVHKHYVCM